MAQYFLTYLQRIGEDYLRWAICDDKSKLVEHHDHGTFAEAARQAGRLRTVMVVAGTELLLEEASVPASNLAKALKAVPYTLEEQLAQDVEASHFAFGTRLPDGSIPVAVVGRASMNWIVEKCGQSGLRPVEIVPEILALPLQQERWTIMTNSGHAAVRLGVSRGFSCDDDMLPLLLDNIPETDAGEKIWQSLHFSCGNDNYALETSERPVRMRSEVELFSRGLRDKRSSRINLLQGSYGKRQASERTWRPWLTPAVLAGLLLALWGGSSFLQYRQLGIEQQQLTAEIESTLKAAFPDVRRVVNPVAQMRTRMQQLNGAEIDSGGFVSMMSSIGEALGEADKPVVRSMNFGRGKVVVDLDASSLQDLDKIKSRLEVGRKLAAKVESANKERDRIRARLRVERRS